MGNEKGELCDWKTTYDLLGREVAVLLNQELEGGRHEIEVMTRNL